MNVRLWKSTVLVGMLLLTSVYAPLWAMQDSTAVAPKTTERPFWIWQFTGRLQPFGGSGNASLNTFLTQSLPGRVPQFSEDPSVFVLTPLNVSWNHNRWIFQIGYSNFSRGTLTNDYSATVRANEVSYEVGYNLINAARFRLYPMLGIYGMIDQLSISRGSTLLSFKTLLTTMEQKKDVSIYRVASMLSIAVGADYRFPLEYGDLYIMAKAGYNLLPGGAWFNDLSFGQLFTDADPNWFSRRGVFFQLGIGFGSERQ